MANNNSKSKGAYTQPDHIKAKSKWTKKATVWTVVIVVIILGILAIIGGESGWFKTADMINGKVEIGDYSVIEIPSSEIEVTDSTVQSYLDSIAASYAVTEVIEEGPVEDGDRINLDYTGVLEGETEPFEGGSAEAASLTLGSGMMIPGFEDQIIGHKIGETFDINVTFPEDYQTEEYAGKNAVFTITINNKSVTTTPELTDELVKEYSSEYLDEELDSVEALKENYIERVKENALQSSIINTVTANTKVIYYNEKDLADLTTYNTSAISYYASTYGMDAVTMAQVYGYDSVTAYADAESKNTLKTTMTLDKIAEEQNITVSDDEVDAVFEKYMESEGFDGTLEEFKSQSVDAFAFLIRETEVLLPKVVDYLKGNVVIIEVPSEEAPAEEPVAETIAETPAETAAETPAETEAETVAETPAETEAETTK